VFQVTIGDVFGLSLVGCNFCSFKSGRLGQEARYLSVSYFFWPLILACQHGISSALNIWVLITLLFCKEDMLEQKVGGLKQLCERV
jgi:hypothetical protein